MRVRTASGRPAFRVTAIVVALLALLAGCSSGGATAAKPTTTTAPAPRPVVTSSVADGATGVPIGQSFGITVTKGTLKSAKLAYAADASGLPAPGDGLMNKAATAWLSPGNLIPSTAYRVTATVLDAHHVADEHTWSFTTGGPVAELHTTTNVNDNSTYGVGMPIIVTLSSPVGADLHKALTDRLAVTSSPATTGAWHWFSDTELHYRTSEYWPAHTAVKLAIDFKGFDAGNGVWGVDGRTIAFNIGDSHISTVDAATHHMVVNINGAPARDMPVSTGQDRYPTKSGIHVVNEKAPTVIMDSATVGIPKGSPDYYYETVQWNVRISNSGEFVHSAPWSVGSQGYENVSHGCVNAAPADAEWFYNLSQTGDVVQVINTPEQLTPQNGYGDWQIPWDQWAN